MFLKLLLIFTAIPVIELSLLIKAGSFIGTMNTVLVVILTAVVGAYMVRMEGLGAISRIQDNLAKGVFPAEGLIDGMMILVSGAFLLTPGFLTDIIGFMMVIPASRGVIKKAVKHYIGRRIRSTHIQPWE